MTQATVRQLLKINAGRSVLITEETTTPDRQTSKIIYSQDFMTGAPPAHNEAHIMRAVLYHAAPDLLEALQLAVDMLKDHKIDALEPKTMATLNSVLEQAQTLPMPLNEALAGIGAPRGTMPSQPRGADKIYRINEPVNYNAHTTAPARATYTPPAPTKSADEQAQDDALAEMRARMGL